MADLKPQRVPNLVLCGFMACGKSTLGRLLAEQTGLPFLDTDDWIEKREGRAVSRIFAERGEPYFRSVERAAVAHAAGLPGAVVATGGGAVLNPQNLWRLGRTGIVFFIDVPAAVLFERLRGDGTRPLARGFESEADVACKLESRRSSYAAVPHRIAAGRRTAEDLAAEILDRYGELIRIP